MSANVTELLLEAAYLMVVGMSVVFLFLAMLIGAMNVVAWLIRKYPESVVPTQKVVHHSASLQSSVPGEVVAAITAAIHEHRKH